jgi:chaperone modulatory protein CbpM
MDQPEPQHGEIVGSGTLTLHELCLICGLEDQLVIELVSVGVIEASGPGPQEWRFTTQALDRSRKALRLHRDLGIEWQGLALALDLLEEVDRLRARVALLERQRLRTT